MTATRSPAPLSRKPDASGKCQSQLKRRNRTPSNGTHSMPAESSRRARAGVFGSGSRSASLSSRVRCSAR
jgi:hypothetical protein